MSISSLVAIVIKMLMIWGSKCHQNDSPEVCDGYAKYEEAEVDRLVAPQQGLLNKTWPFCNGKVRPKKKYMFVSDF